MDGLLEHAADSRSTTGGVWVGSLHGLACLAPEQVSRLSDASCAEVGLQGLADEVAERALT
jgi:hypothetical protein